MVAQGAAKYQRLQKNPACGVRRRRVGIGRGGEGPTPEEETIYPFRRPYSSI